MFISLLFLSWQDQLRYSSALPLHLPLIPTLHCIPTLGPYAN